MKPNSWWTAPSLLLIGLGASCSAQAVYSDLGSGNSFSSNFWCVTGYDSYGCTSSVQQQIAASFTPSATATLGSISLALGYYNGTNEVSIALTSNADGSPGTTLESWKSTEPPRLWRIDSAHPGQRHAQTITPGGHHVLDRRVERGRRYHGCLVHEQPGSRRRLGG